MAASTPLCFWRDRRLGLPGIAEPSHSPFVATGIRALPRIVVVPATAVAGYGFRKKFRWVGGGDMGGRGGGDRESRPVGGARGAVRQGVRGPFGAFGKDRARGLSVRHYHGSQCMSDGRLPEGTRLSSHREFACLRAS